MKRLEEVLNRDTAFLLQEQAEVREWVESLPWDGDLIELHFNW